MAAGLYQFALGAGDLAQTETQPKETSMTFCGHNKDMASGITGFSGGLAAQTRKRALDEGVSIVDIPRIEMEEIEALLEALRASPKKEALRGIAAVGELIRYFYSELDAQLKVSPETPVEKVFEATVLELNRLLFAMEANYYEALRPKFPRLEAVRRIRDFLETQVK